MSLGLILRAAALGFSSGGFCLGFCLPVILPLLLGTGVRGYGRIAVRILYFLGGRLVAYAGVGIIAGMLGGKLNLPVFFRTALLPMSYLFLGLLMIIYGITSLDPFVRWKFCRMIQPQLNTGWFLFFPGILAGISPCPPFLLALANVFDYGGVLNGALFFFIFFLGTSVYFLPLLFAGLAVRFETVRLAARMVAIITGLYFVLYSLTRLFIIN